MSKLSILLIIPLILLSCSSDRGIDARLHVAGTIMDERPDSALTILQEIRPENIGSGKSRALYGLLLTQARVKNYIPVSNDSLIREAADYFDLYSYTFALRPIEFMASVKYTF